jgi:hypothetical protein
MPFQVDDALLRAMSRYRCPAYEPNSGSFFPSPPTEGCSRREEPTLLCNHLATSTHLSCKRGGLNRSTTHWMVLQRPVELAALIRHVLSETTG